MSKVGIVVDSTNCLPTELIREYDIRVVPYHLVLEGKDYYDQIDITPAEFWQRFEGLQTLPTTAIPSPGEYVSVFSDLAKSTDSILCSCVSSGVSGAYESMATAKATMAEEHPNLKIEFVDSKNSAGALGFIVLEAARAAQEGKSLAEVVKVAQDLVPRVRFFFALETLKYLIKGGRAPKSAIIGEFLRVKPIISIDNSTGTVISSGKERGKRKTMLKLVDMINNYADISKPLHVIVHFTDNIEGGAALREMITSRYNCAEIYMTDLTPVMTAHTGPAVGLSFYSER
ncbi:DegV family protein [Chloroflexota bacterium]